PWCSTYGRCPCSVRTKSIADGLATGVHAASTLAGGGPFARLAPTCSPVALLGGNGLRNRARRERATIHRFVGFRRLAPGEILAHRPARQLGEPLAILIQRHRALHGPVEGFGAIGVVQDAGHAVLDRVGESADTSRDGQCAVELRTH